MTNLTTQLPEDIRNEFQADSDGKVYAKSIRAIARLAGVDHKSVLALLERVKNGGEVTTSETLQTLTGVDFQVGNSEIIRIPDIAVASIITYYAYESKAANDTAKRVALAFSSIGFRTYM